MATQVSLQVVLFLRPSSARNRQIRERFKAGTKLERLSTDYGVSKPRIVQILQMEGLGRHDGGASISGKVKRTNDLTSENRGN